MSLRSRIDRLEAQVRPQLLDAELDRAFIEAGARVKAGLCPEIAALSDEALLDRILAPFAQMPPEESAAYLRLLKRWGML